MHGEKKEHGTSRYDTHFLLMDEYECLCVFLCFLGAAAAVAKKQTATKKGSQSGFAMRKEVDQNPTCTK